VTRRADLLPLIAEGARIRARRPRNAELCGLINARSGGCPEDCAFCAQSAAAAAGPAVYPLLPASAMVRRAEDLVRSGASHVCLVMSGRGPSDADLDRICQAARRIRDLTGVSVCASLGLINPAAAARLKAAGVSRYNHNLETARSFFPRICTTHRWEDRRRTALAVREAGLELCCGGIVGMGESEAQRDELAAQLAELDPDVVPLNFLNPRPGTPLAGAAPLRPLDALREVARFRLALPRAALKLAGGRELALRALQATALLGGADGLIVGGYLTTAGRPVADDLRMLADCGLPPGSPAEPPAGDSPRPRGSGYP
jgi:biotin synthase